MSRPVELYRFSLGLTSWHQTNSPQQFDLLGQTYVPEYLRRSEISYTTEESRQEIKVRVKRDHPVVKLFAAGDQIGRVGLTILEADRDVPGSRFIWRGRLIGPTWEREGDGLVAVLSGIPVFSELARGLLGIRLMPSCYKELYGVLCRADRNAFRESGTATDVQGNVVQSQVFASQTDGYFNGGWIEVGGVAKRAIVTHLGNAVQLTGPIPDLATGGTFDAYPGCDQSTGPGGCAKFNNLANHGGKKFVPGRNPNTGGL